MCHHQVLICITEQVLKLINASVVTSIFTIAFTPFSPILLLTIYLVAYIDSRFVIISIVPFSSAAFLPFLSHSLLGLTPEYAGSSFLLRICIPCFLSDCSLSLTYFT